MEWHQYVGPVFAIGTPVVGFIVWLVRLESKSAQTDKDLKRHEDETDERFGVVNTAIGLTQGDVRELQIKSISRDDLKDVENKLTASIEKVGDRTDAAVERLITVFNKKPAAPRASRPRS